MYTTEHLPRLEAINQPFLLYLSKLLVIIRTILTKSKIFMLLVPLSVTYPPAPRAFIYLQGNLSAGIWIPRMYKK